MEALHGTCARGLAEHRLSGSAVARAVHALGREVRLSGGGPDVSITPSSFRPNPRTSAPARAGRGAGTSRQRRLPASRLRYAPTVASLLTLEQAQERVLARARPLPAELVSIGQAGGRVVAEDVRAQVDLPPFASSAMDGFAVRAADLPGALRIMGESAAGAPFTGRLEPGAAVAISTGAVVPEGADSVVPIEHVVKQANTVDISGIVSAGSNVRPRGGDIAAGAVVVTVGTPFTPGLIGAAAAAGV